MTKFGHFNKLILPIETISITVSVLYYLILVVLVSFNNEHIIHNIIVYL